MARNLLFLCSDEHARSALGCHGHPVADTPALDRLAARGMRFTRAYTPSPICISARASIATGLHVFQHRCWSSAEPYCGQHESWMHRLRDRGHAVVSVGKLHFRSGNDDNGFSEEILPMYLANDGAGWPQALVRDPLPSFPEAAELAAELGPGETDYTEYDRKIAAEASRWIRRYPTVTRNRPWALFVSFVSPHFPLVAPQAFFDRYADEPMPEPFARSANAQSNHPALREMRRFWNYDDYFDDATRRLARRNYYGLCSFLDDNIRQVLAALEDSGQANETLVIYTSDHGEMLGNHGFWAKSVMYEDSVAVPMVLSGPGVPAGVNHTPVSLTDLAATIEGAVAPGPRPTVARWEGRPLQGFIDAPETDRFILSEYHDGGSPTGVFMIRHGRWKLVHYAGDYADQLFDLDGDPQELDDLGENPAYRAQTEVLRGLLEQILDPTGVNDQAMADQRRLMEELGGAERILAMPGFNHTPLPS